MNRITLLGFLFLSLLWQSCDNAKASDTGDSVSNSTDETGYYQEDHRLQYHFSPEEGWINDPNGMVYYDGEYHLFYQYYPYATVWGPMHWHHAVSKDMVHWEHLPVALYPDKLGMIFSGSAVVDKNNTAGFKTGEEDPLIAIYTYHDMVGEKLGRSDYQTQGIAYSNDKGRTWTKYAGNPVVKNPGFKDIRDPKVVWHEPSQQWVMVLSRGSVMQFYNSPDLKNWKLTSDFGEGQGNHGGVWECPDIFSLPIDGNENNQKWVLIVNMNPGGPNGGSGTQYFIGDFDGKKFTNDNSPTDLLYADFGKDNYAGVTWSDIPSEDGRRLFIGWLSNWQYARDVPTHPWRNAMTLPRELNLKTTPSGIRLFSTPVKELEKLRTQTNQIAAQSISNKEVSILSNGIDASQSELELTFDMSKTDAKSFGIKLSNAKGEVVRFAYEQESGLFIFDRTQSGKIQFSNEFPGLQFIPRILDNNIMKLQIFIDRSSMEVFADDGHSIITNIFFPTEDYNQITLYADHGNAELVSGNIYALKGIWK